MRVRAFIDLGQCLGSVNASDDSVFGLFAHYILLQSIRSLPRCLKEHEGPEVSHCHMAYAQVHAGMILLIRVSGCGNQVLRLEVFRKLMVDAFR